MCMCTRQAIEPVGSDGIVANAALYCLMLLVFTVRVPVLTLPLGLLAFAQFRLPAELGTLLGAGNFAHQLMGRGGLKSVDGPFLIPVAMNKPAVGSLAPPILEIPTEYNLSAIPVKSCI